ncbi:MAG: HslU--HslV peptidase ATPase subunit, partial [gamma proteobacterium symbiont of Ctena orbiculata]
ELAALTTDDFTRILTEPDASLTEQYQALLETEKVGLSFTEAGIRRIAETAWQVNERTENIGARRLHTVMERLLESISFNASEHAGATLVIDEAYVDDQLSQLAADEDLSQYIL